MQAYWREWATAAALAMGVTAVVAMPAAAQNDNQGQYTQQQGQYNRQGRDSQRGQQQGQYNQQGQYSQQQNDSRAQRSYSGQNANRPDYSNNEYYRTGNDDGYTDYKAHNRQKHEHQYKTDDDRQAYDYGYNDGWSGRSYRDNDEYRNRQTYGDNGQYRNNRQYNSDENRRDDQRYRDTKKHDDDDH